MMVHQFWRNGEETGEQLSGVDEHQISPSSPCTDMSLYPLSQGGEENTLSTPATECSAVEAEPLAAGKVEMTTGNRISWPEGPESIDAPDNPDPSPPNIPSNAGNNQQPLAHTTEALCPDPGSTSNPIRFFSPSAEDVENETAVNLDSSQVQKVLLEIAWRYLSLQTRLVREQYFLAHRELGGRSQYYSPFLENTLLACASRMSTSAAIRKLGKAYIDRAVKTIPVELENPMLSTVQGFLLLADFEATRGRDRPGWTYMGQSILRYGPNPPCWPVINPFSGIACRLLLFDLGWDDQREPFASKDELASCDIQCWYTVYLSAFVHDTLWSLYLRRPRTISLPILHATQYSAQNTVENRILQVWVDLCVHIAELNDVLLPQTCPSITQLLELDSRIQKVYEALPPDLAYQQMASAELDAAAYTCYMQFYSTRIMLHREIKSSLDGETPSCESVPLANSSFRYTPNHSSTTMYSSAVSIAELAVTYRQIFGLDKMIAVMLNAMYMAVVTLIDHVLILQDQGVHAERDIRRICQLVDTLDQIQTHFPIASRMYQTLSRTLSDTSLSYLARSSQSSAISINSWGAMGTPVENRASSVSLGFSGIFDERYEPWIPDMDMFTVVSEPVEKIN